MEEGGPDRVQKTLDPTSTSSAPGSRAPSYGAR
jgi:hypothetical protein